MADLAFSAPSVSAPTSGSNSAVRGWTPAAIAGGLLALLLPPFLVSLPPVMDYPNHLARMWLIAGGAEQAPVNAMYAVDFSRAWTNIGVDLLARFLGPPVGAERLAPAVLAVSIALPPLGAAMLNRSVFRGWHWWQIGFAGLAWSFSAIAGFMNFQIGLGLALLFASADPVLARGGPVPATLGRAACALVLLLFHPFDVMFYAALLGGLAMGPAYALRELRTLAPALGRAVGPVLAAVSPLVAMFLFAPTAPGAEADGLPWISWRPDRLEIATSAMRSYGPAFDLPVALALAGVVVWAVRERALRVHAGLLTAAGALGFVAMAMPHKLGDTFFTDHRLPVMALLTAVAAVRPEPALRPRHAAALGAALLALGLGRTAGVTGVWMLRQADVSDARRAMAPVPAGAAVLPVVHYPSDAKVADAPVGRFVDTAAFWHFSALLVPERRAFTPTLFTAAGKQPLRVKPPYDGMDSPNAPVIAFSALGKPAAEIPPRVDYLRQWRERFDYVLVLNADMADDGATPFLPELEPVADEGFARLYRIRRPAP